MCESMIERVARAIYDQQSDGAGPVSDFYPVARAAIEAMRDPTDAMVDCGAYVVGNQSFSHDKPLPTLSNAYTAMIDAALNEQVAG